MKRSVLFKCNANEYVFQEGEKTLFFIKKEDLKFDSLSFYNGIYPPGCLFDIELIKQLPPNLSSEELRLAEHVFKCVNEIITNIESEIHNSKKNLGTE